MSLSIGIDLDGCVYNFVEDFRQYLVKEHQTPLETLPEPERWEMWEFWGITKDRFAELIGEGIRDYNLFANDFLYPGAREALNALTVQGHELHIVTARDPMTQARTRQWLARNGIHYTSLTFSKDKTCALNDVFIEDNVKNALDLRAVGTRPLLIARMWNMGDHNIPRLIWPEVPAVVNAMAQQKEARVPTGEVRGTSGTGGQKGRKPERMSLIPHEALAAVARVYGFGEKKYAANNWRKGYPWSWSLDALHRHVGAFQAGEDLDPESGEPHLAHAAFHILALLTWQLDGGYTEHDDRYTNSKEPT